MSIFVPGGNNVVSSQNVCGSHFVERSFNCKKIQKAGMHTLRIPRSDFYESASAQRSLFVNGQPNKFAVGYGLPKIGLTYHGLCDII